MLEILSYLAGEVKVLTMLRLSPGSLLLVSDPVRPPVVVVVAGVAAALLLPVAGLLLAQAGPGSHQVAVTEVTSGLSCTETNNQQVGPKIPSQPSYV